MNEIVRFVGGKYSNISQQLKMLTYAGYLTKERKERAVIYHLRDEKIRAIIDFLCHLFKNPETRSSEGTKKQGGGAHGSL